MCTAKYIYILAVFSTAAAGEMGSAKKRPDVNMLGIALQYWPCSASHMIQHFSGSDNGYKKGKLMAKKPLLVLWNLSEYYYLKNES